MQEERIRPRITLIGANDGHGFRTKCFESAGRPRTAFVPTLREAAAGRALRKSASRTDSSRGELRETEQESLLSCSRLPGRNQSEGGRFAGSASVAADRWISV
jgi:hypothetical protein